MKNTFKYIGATMALTVFCSYSFAGFTDLIQNTATQALSGEKSTSTSALSKGEIDQGLKEALSVGAERAVALLGTEGGFLDNSEVRIPLPGSLETVGSALRSVGQGAIVDDFELTINRAAEEAIPQTLDIVKATVQNMTLDDVRGILAGGDDAATQFLRKKSWDSMHEAVMPIISKATDNTGATASYKKLVSSSGSTMGALGGLLGGKSDALDLDSYATDKTLDGLFYMLAQEEKQIRNNPLARSTEILKQVFGN